MVGLFFVLALLLQTAAPTVVVGLVDGQKLAVSDPSFTGFIESREGGESVLIYRQKNFRGELKLSSIQRIDLAYKNGQTFPLKVTLRTGQILDVESTARDFLMVKGTTDSGTVTVKHPDPISPARRLSTKPANRKDHLTIQYLEFPR